MAYETKKPVELERWLIVAYFFSVHTDSVQSTTVGKNDATFTSPNTSASCIFGLWIQRRMRWMATSREQHNNVNGKSYFWRWEQCFRLRRSICQWVELLQLHIWIERHRYFALAISQAINSKIKSINNFQIKNQIRIFIQNKNCLSLQENPLEAISPFNKLVSSCLGADAMMLSLFNEGEWNRPPLCRWMNVNHQSAELLRWCRSSRYVPSPAWSNQMNNLPAKTLPYDIPS